MDNPIRGAKITENIKVGFKENLIFQWTQASESDATGVLVIDIMFSTLDVDAAGVPVSSVLNELLVNLSFARLELH